MIYILFSRRALNKMPVSSLILGVCLILKNHFRKKKFYLSKCIIFPPHRIPTLAHKELSWFNMNSCFFEIKLVLHTTFFFFFGYQITQNALIAASVKLHSFHSRIIFSPSPLFHFGSLHLGFQNFLEKESTDWNMFSQVFVECHEHCE